MEREHKPTVTIVFRSFIALFDGRLHAEYKKPRFYRHFFRFLPYKLHKLDKKYGVKLHKLDKKWGVKLHGLEFLAKKGQDIIPIDVKTKRGSLASIDGFSNHNPSSVFVKASRNRYGLNEATKILTIPLLQCRFALPLGYAT